uniref:Homologous-pairing protein 2 winged helix domain-containing protein n=1 Tax=Setaria digitata TaxID=48799 RepID=A0A915PJ43_9BILA
MYGLNRVRTGISLSKLKLTCLMLGGCSRCVISRCLPRGTEICSCYYVLYGVGCVKGFEISSCWKLILDPILTQSLIRTLLTYSTLKPNAIHSSTMSRNQPDETAIDLVCNYMLQQNRPYSAVDVWNNLRQEYPKSQIIRCLDIGVERGILREKLISKQKIYFYNQSKIEKCGKEELQVINQSIAEKKNRVDQLSSEIKVIKNELKAYESALTIEEMTMLRVTLIAQIKEIEERIINMEAHAKNEVTNKGKKSELIAKEKFYMKHYKERKRIAERIVDTICENIDTSRKKLMVCIEKRRLDPIKENLSGRYGLRTRLFAFFYNYLRNETLRCFCHAFQVSLHDPEQ